MSATIGGATGVLSARRGGSHRACTRRDFPRGRSPRRFHEMPFPATDARRQAAPRSASAIPGRDGLPRLLFLCQTLPYPPHGGVSIRTLNVMRQLSRAFDITALCFYRRAQHPDAATLAQNLAALRRTVRAETFPIPQEHSRSRLLWDHARSLITRTPFTTFVYESESFETRLQELLGSSSFALVHVDSLDLARYLPTVTAAAPVVCVHHNVESMLLRRRSLAERQMWRRRYVAFQAGLLEEDERHWYDRVDLNVTVSPNDRDAVLQVAPRANVQVVPNGVDVETFQPMLGKEEGLVFAGGAGWFPNRDGMEYLGRDILPLIRRDGNGVPVCWVGRATPAERERFAAEFDVTMTGYVPDVRPYLADAACYVVPLRVGGGTRLKILDAWAMGKAIVSTSVGCEGLDARDGDNILIRDTPEAFAEAVRQVLADAQLRKRLGSAGRRTVETTYGWEVIGPPMIRSYYALIGAGKEADGA